MSHMVIYRGTDGKPGYHQTDDIHDAVGFVEELRNSQGVDHARIFRLEEVTFEYKPYYRVELGTASTAIGSGDTTDGDEDSSSDDDTDEATAEDTSDDGSDSDDLDDADDAAAEGDDDTDASSNGDAVASGTARRGLFGR